MPSLHRRTRLARGSPSKLSVEVGTGERWGVDSSQMDACNLKITTNHKTWNPHLHAISDLGLSEILEILDRGEELKTAKSAAAQFSGFVLGLLFFQGSTRTRLGFHAAAARLGITGLTLDTMRYEPKMSKPEDPLDAFRSVAPYCDLIVLRHDNGKEFLKMMGRSRVPVINGGSGVRHHPTQTLIDLFSVRTRTGCLDGLRWGIAGDLASSRTARSLIDSLKRFEISELRLMSPTDRRLRPTELSGIPPKSIRNFDHLSLAGLDVLYMAGYPPGSGKHREPPQRRLRFRLTVERAQELSESALILNPLPRIDEIDREVDDLPQAIYFEQSGAGLFVRMAILERILLRAIQSRNKGAT